ncbi:MAG TPA: twin-arginine translocase TatA/TatE family subunit [Pseudonocardia sp.]|jgi:sec-independent protein translocase protein TatA
MGELSPIHWLIVIAIAAILFGAQRLPDVARGVGRSARILRAELSGLSGPAAAERNPEQPPDHPA